MKNLVFNLRTAKAQAEGCAKVSRMAKVLTTLTLLLTLGVGQMWGVNVKKPIVYFNNQTPNWSTSNLYFAVGHSTYTRLYNTTTISNTKLQYVNLGAYDCSYCNCDCQQWGDATYVAFCRTTSAWDQAGSYGYDNIKNAQKYSGQKNGYDMNDGNTYYCYMANADNGATLSVDYKKSGYSDIPKFNATQGAKWRDAGTSYAITTGTYPATLKLQGTYLSGNGKSARSTITSTASTDGDAKKVYGAVVTGEITHSFESLNSSYYFEGWGTGSTPSSTENTYSYNISENTTTYAFFSKTYTLTYDRKGTFGNSTLSVDVSNFSGTKESGSAIPTGHQIIFTATPASGYVIEGWYSDEACTVSLDNGQNPTYIISSLDADKSVYVKFEQLKTITIKFAHEAKDGWTIQGVRRYPESGGQRISANGKWVTIEFTNVYAVSNIDLAYSGGDWDYLNTATKITGDCCYNKDGSLNASCCVQPANPTWGTAPKNGDKGGSMTASVSGAPAGATITWSSTNPSAATVDNYGVIRYVATGNTTIKANVTWIESGDYCAGSYELSQEISVTSGAMVSVERTCAAYVAAGVAEQVSAHITFTGTSSGWKYRIKHYWDAGYETGWLDASGTSADWTMTGGMGDGERTYTVELYTTEGAATPVSTANFSVTGETAYNTTIAAGANGSVSPSGTVYANNNHVHPTITATPNEHYHFVNWTSNNAAASVADDNSATTTVTATASGYTITANFAGDKYTITYKDQGGVDYSGNNEGSLPATHTYGTATDLVNGTKEGFTFGGWYTDAECTGEAVTSIGATAKTSNFTLYAKWTPSGYNARITFVPGNIIAPGATVTVTATIEPAPAGETTICWRVLYSNDNPLAPQPKFTPAEAQGKSVSFKAPEASGSYKVEATLRKGTGCGGEEIHTFTAPFQVAGDHTVTVQYKCGSEVIAPSTTVTGKPLEWTEVVAHDIFGYHFSGWTAGDGVTIEEAATGRLAELQAEDASIVAVIKMKAIYDGKLTAVYTSKRMIYFNNTLGWKGVTVYFYKNASYWNDTYGAGADNTYGYTNTPYSDGKHGDMTQIEGTNIWYFDLDANEVPANLTTVNFTELNQHGYGYFAETGNVKNNVAHPCNNAALFNVNMPMYVPIDDDGVLKNGGKAKYYFNGYWMCYPNYSGYTLKIYNTADRNGEPTAIKSFDFPYSDGYVLPMSVDVDLEANKKYYFDVYRNDNTLFGNNGDMKYGNSGPWSFFNTDTRRAGITTTAAGNYRFTWSFFKESSTYNYHMTVTYPVAPNDYRVIYTDNDTWTTTHTLESWVHPSRIISAEENAVDTISFFVSKGHSPEFKIQKVNTIDEGTGAITWTDVTDWISCDDVDASGVYNFIFTQDGSKNISFTKKEPYTGNFYIRTDAANSKWDNYRSDPDHLMTYSEYSITHGGYSHYYCHWVDKDAWGGTRKNIKFCIANDYSPCISDTLIRENNRDPAWANINNYIDEKGNILRNANVRFMWNQSTNKVSRAYVDGTQGTGSNNFLYILSEDNKIRKMDESALDDHKVSFSDNENWIYEANIQAQPKAAIKLLSNWGTSNTITQYFKGSSNTTEYLIDGSGEKWYNIRLLYDFKTNRLVAAMVPTGNIDDPMPINADVMFIREHQGDIEQLTFTGNGAITDIKTAYAVMRFNKWTLNNKEKTGSHNPLASPASIYERSLYYVSFPFPVNLSEVFGFGTYGQHWIIQRYRGDLRAQQGFWAESAGFWEFIWNRNGVVLQPNEGYILTLETELLGEESDVWGPDQRSNQIELFFPSTGPLGSITNASVTQELPKHTCTIDKTKDQFGKPTGLQDSPDPSTSYNRTVFDSHWNIMSVPTYVNVDDPNFVNTTWIGGEKGNVGPKFLYTWNMNDNTLTATSGTDFMYHAMHAYTVQYYGDVTWTTSVTPTAAPQRNTEYRGEYEFCLEVQQDEQMIDRTYVRLSDDENVTTGFEFSEDMTKQFNSRKANIFTIAGNTSLGGNSLPLSTTQTTVVPVGVKIKTAGDYTFSIPEGTDGIGVTLVDNETGVRTSLSALEYTVNLTAGTHDQRFVLEISPIQNTPTGIEEPTSDSSLKGRAQKRIIDGVLYIVKDGKIFDARGKRVE